jgi:D-inositol-3-phosphate glycosyltransferase
LVQDGVTGFTGPVDDPMVLMDCMVKLLSDPQLREKMGKQAAEFAKGFGWELIAKKIIALYQSVLPSHH